MLKDFKDWIFEAADEVEPESISNSFDLDPEWLRSLKDNPNDQVRGRVAYHKNTPLDVRLELVKDPQWTVRSWAAFGADHLPEEVIRELAKDPQSAVREEIARQDATPLDVVYDLSEDPNDYVRWAVATRWKCPTDILVKLTQDKSKWVSKSAIEKLDARGGVFQELFADF